VCVYTHTTRCAPIHTPRSRSGRTPSLLLCTLSVLL